MNAVIAKNGDRKVVLFHRTTVERASAILSSGFRDGVISYGPKTRFEGVWVSNIPLRPDQGVKGGAILRITTELSEAELREYEWTEERLTHREWLIPARVLNAWSEIALERHPGEPDRITQ
jgi:hypothetical protein